MGGYDLVITITNSFNGPNTLEDLVNIEGTRSRISGLDLETFSRSGNGRLK